MSQVAVFDVMHGQAVHNGQTQSAGNSRKAARAYRAWQTRGLPGWPGAGGEKALRAEALQPLPAEAGTPTGD